jgi:hypothetical protein
MNRDQPAASPTVEVALRIPGQWASVEALAARLPLGCRLDDRYLYLEDDSKYEWNALNADDEFLKIFAQSCQRMPSERDRDVIEHYTVNFCLICPGGSIAAAKNVLRAAAAVLRAGGAGVFVDNAGIAHGSDDWHSLSEGADDGGVFWAFIAFIGNKKDIYSVGMHILGHRDAIMPRTGNDEKDRLILASFLGYTYRSGVTLSENEIIADPSLPSFQLKSDPDERMPKDAPMHNPFGRWRLEPVEVG